MDALHCIQHFQLRLVKSAAITDDCASDLLDVLCKLSDNEASRLVGIIGLLQHEADSLRALAKTISLDSALE